MPRLSAEITRHVLGLHDDMGVQLCTCSQCRPCCRCADGTTTLHALGELQVRGTLFIGTHSDTYSGMIIGESAREADMEARRLLLNPPLASSCVHLPRCLPCLRHALHASTESVL